MGDSALVGLQIPVHFMAGTGRARFLTGRSPFTDALIRNAGGWTKAHPYGRVVSYGGGLLPPLGFNKIVRYPRAGTALNRWVPKVLLPSIMLMILLLNCDILSPQPRWQSIGLPPERQAKLKPGRRPRSTSDPTQLTLPKGSGWGEVLKPRKAKPVRATRAAHRIGGKQGGTAKELRPCKQGFLN